MRGDRSYTLARPVVGPPEAARPPAPGRSPTPCPSVRPNAGSAHIRPFVRPPSSAAHQPNSTRPNAHPSSHKFALPSLRPIVHPPPIREPVRLQKALAGTRSPATAPLAPFPDRPLADRPARLTTGSARFTRHHSHARSTDTPPHRRLPARPPTRQQHPPVDQHAARRPNAFRINVSINCSRVSAGPG